MSVYESVLLFLIAALLVTAGAIHGFVFVMLRLDGRREARRRAASGNEKSNDEF